MAKGRAKVVVVAFGIGVLLMAKGREWAKGKAEYYNNELSALVAWQGEDTERGAPQRTRVLNPSPGSLSSQSCDSCRTTALARQVSRGRFQLPLFTPRTS